MQSKHFLNNTCSFEEGQFTRRQRGGGDKGGVITKGKGVTKMKLTPTAKYSMCRPYMLAAKLYLHEGNKRKQHVVHNF